MNIASFISFLNEAEQVKHILRHSWTSSGRQESVAEHTWRMALMAMLLRDEFPDANTDHVIQMCLVHDLGECYSGDIPAFEQDEDKLVREEKNISRLTKDLDENWQGRILDLWREYNECSTQEAKIAKALDKMEVLIQHNEADISTWDERERSFNLKYGQDFHQFHQFFRDMRKEVDDQTREKLD